MDNVAFVEKMLFEWGLIGCNPVRVPITKGTMTRLDDAMKQELFYGKEECTEFRSLLGMLHWLPWLPLPCQNWLLLTACLPNTLLHQLKAA